MVAQLNNDRSATVLKHPGQQCYIYLTSCWYHDVNKCQDIRKRYQNDIDLIYETSSYLLWYQTDISPTPDVISIRIEAKDPKRKKHINREVYLSLDLKLVVSSLWLRLQFEISKWCQSDIKTDWNQMWYHYHILSISSITLPVFDLNPILTCSYHSKLTTNIYKIRIIHIYSWIWIVIFDIKLISFKYQNSPYL